MALTLPQKNWISRSTTTPEAIATKINEGVVPLDEFKALGAQSPAIAQKVSAVLSLLASLPDPVEMREFADINSMYATAPAGNATFNAISAYLARWGASSAAAEHVAQAREWYNSLNMDQAYRSIEQSWQKSQSGIPGSRVPSAELRRVMNDFVSNYTGKAYAANALNMVQQWLSELHELEAVERRNRRALLVVDGKLHDWDEAVRYLRDFPDDHETAAILDDLMWTWVTLQPDPSAAARRYVEAWGSVGRHNADVAMIRHDAVEWDKVKDADIYALIAFKKNNPNSIFSSAAAARIEQSKQEVLNQIRREGVTYPTDSFLTLANSGIFTREELLWATDCENDPDMLDEILKFSDTQYDLNLLWNDKKDQLGSGLGSDDVTDVIFFGIAGSGKTCALTGLLLNDNLSYNSHRFSAPYAECVRAFGEKGFAMNGTPEEFVATLECTVKSGSDNYRFNLFDMAGEVFRKKIAMSDVSGEKFTIDMMGKGAPEILAKPNDKLFFMFIDPGVDDIHLREQGTAIRKFMSLMFDDNPDVMSRVRGLHFIVTKADMLGEYSVRRHKALEHVCRVLNSKDRDELVEKCRKFGINQSNDDKLNGHPRVYPFSLGKFFVTNRYRLDDTSSNEILQIITDYSAPEVKGGFLSYVRSFFIKPII